MRSRRPGRRCAENSGQTRDRGGATFSNGVLPQRLRPRTASGLEFEGYDRIREAAARRGQPLHEHQIHVYVRLRPRIVVERYRVVSGELIPDSIVLDGRAHYMPEALRCSSCAGEWGDAAPGVTEGHQRRSGDGPELADNGVLGAFPPDVCPIDETVRELVDLARRGDKASFRELAAMVGVAPAQVDALWAGTRARVARENNGSGAHGTTPLER